MKVEIDDKRLKQLYNLESYCKAVFHESPGQPYTLTPGQHNMMHDLLKPISNRPTLDELVEVFEEARGYQYNSPPEIRNGLKAVIDKVLKGIDKPKQYRPTLDELVRVYTKETGEVSYRVSFKCRAGLKAVIEKVLKGIDEEYNETDRGIMAIHDSHREGYKEE